YKERKKIPVWAMLTLSILPVWGFMYVRALTPQEVVAAGPMGLGQTSYSVCASCHGAGGEGGAGRPFAGGEVGKTFPHIEDQLRFVHLGTTAYVDAGIASYGDPNREGGAHAPKSFGIMPSASKDLGMSDVDILNVVCYERYGVGGMEQDADYDKWCSETSEIHAALASGANTFADLQDAFPDIIPIGDVPVEGTTAG
ncbi:MAG: hypothetical protein KDB12_00020, partial [Ilumatobacter sp.]|nr:hypothetical protein [Ilumatobacter sp.]